MIKLLKLSLITIIALFIIAFIYLNTIFKNVAEDYGKQITKTEVGITYASLSPFSGNISVGGLDVGNPQGFKQKNAIEFSSISADVDTSSIFSDTIIIDELRIKKPVINYEIGVNGDNIRTLLNNIKSGKISSGSSSAGSGKKKDVVIKNLYLEQGKVKLSADLFGMKAGEEIDFPDMHLTDIGTKNGGTSPAKASELIIAELNKELLKLKAGKFTDQIKGNLNKALGDLF
ncbi:MAG: hypothetical protein COV36_05815 [Alphaproteobacteria bacterium CG11_big_fil_rev_8_21_14_0_20_44_7]|nr:MAG: hypothetical protein COV36_05815 [Alphaproteobacteria bacterium CG11_big_fil_rev_8_21_14_0_20_44_7]